MATTRSLEHSQGKTHVSPSGLDSLTLWLALRECSNKDTNLFGSWNMCIKGHFLYAFLICFEQNVFLGSEGVEENNVAF